MGYLSRKRDLRVCESKQKFATAEAAWAAARALGRKKGVNARAYRCGGKRGERRHWHITSGRW